jgi:hypothetical protein
MHDPTLALQLFRTGRTVYLAKPPYLSEPVLTTRIPCGRTVAFSLGRRVGNAMPTPEELTEDLVAGQQQLSRLQKKAA